MGSMAEQDSSCDGPRSGRRGFFRQGLAKLVEPLAGYIEQRVDLTELRPYLRPPGALPEGEFLVTCYRSGNCVRVCPVHAIQPLTGTGEEQDGTPTINPNVAACVACETVACTRDCPSGALQLLTHPRQIRMGTARVDHQVCVRHLGEDCTICVDKCPMGSDAIVVADNGRIRVFEPDCVGCGVCQLHCPAQPKAIVVQIA